MKYGRTASVLAAGAILVSGCSSAETDAQATDTPTTDEPTTVEAKAAEATVTQVASLMARHNGDLQDAIAEVEDACDFTLPSDPCSGVGGIAMLTLTTQAQTLAIDLGAIDDPDAGQYLGAIPSEIRDLTDSTVLAAERLGAIDVEADGPFDISRAIHELQRELDAWAPYF